MNKTQCTHCLKVYVISAEQYSASEGVVTCGSCNQEFYASFINEAADLNNRSDGLIEIEEEPLPAPKFSFDESLNSEMSIIFDDDDSESIIDETDFEPRPAFARSQYSMKLPQKRPIVLTQLADEQIGDEVSDQPQSLSFSEDIGDTDTDLIDEVDQLIEDKILPAPLATEVADQIEDISTNEMDDSTNINIPKNNQFKIRRQKTSLFKKLFVMPILLLLFAVLAIALLYQMWLRQMIFWPDHAVVQSIIKPAAIPIQQKLNQYNITLPERRNLNGLQLLAADVEAHATRASTILLRVSLINRAKISQALPTMELTLTDADGRLISRRSLVPEDYLHNNRTNNSIGINELKKVTIELLAFPKQATGYEIRILGDKVKKPLS